MRIAFLLSLLVIIGTSCSNKGDTAQTFCDTTCVNDTFAFEGNETLRQYVAISVKNCEADTLNWTHIGKENMRKLGMKDLLNETVRLHRSAINGAILDTTAAWINFNDCITGRGYLLKINLDHSGGVSMISSAINSFDKKFAIEPNLRAYTDRGNIYVDNVLNGKRAEMTFKEEYEFDFNNIHETLDSVNITSNRIYVKLIKDGEPVELEKEVDLEGMSNEQ